MDKLFKHFVYGNWWVALCAMAMACLSWHEMFNLDFPLPLIFFIIGSTLIIYNLNMLLGFEGMRSKRTSSERHHWCMDHGTTLKVNTAVGILMSVVSVWWFNYSLLLLLLPFGAITATYVLPLLRQHGTTFRLREIGLWKIFIIAAVWAAMTVFIPAIYHENISNLRDPRIWGLFLERAIFILAITIPFDIRDLENDGKNGVKTLPSVLGWQRTVWLALALLMLFGGLIVFRLGIHSPGSWAYLATALITMMVVALAKPTRSDMYCSFWLEGTMMLQACAVLWFILL